MAAGKRNVGRVRVLTKKRDPETGLCLLVENGRPCTRRVASRGVCDAHLTHLRKVGRVDEFALPRQERRRLRIERTPDPEPGICRVTVEGTACTRAAQRRGLCKRHYAGIWQRDDLDLEDFCLPPLVERLRIKREILPGFCRIREAGVDCEEAHHARGLCSRHYKRLAIQPELFERFALPTRKAIHYSRRTRLRDGRCRVAENGKGCPEVPVVRGLCKHHHAVLHKDPAMMVKIAIPARKVVRRHFARAEDVGDSPDCCVVLENGERCTRSPFRRGVCQWHHTVLGSHADYSLHDFYVEAPGIELSPKPMGDRADGLCIVLENGIACERPPFVRGLCPRHYRYATESGDLDELALPARKPRHQKHGTANLLPHGFLDKNILFDHADWEIFRTSGQAGSVALVERTLRGEFRASVSVDAVKTTYNHVRHRLQRPVEEGGRGASEDEAEERARAYVRDTFFTGGAWRLVALGPLDIADVVLRDSTALSLEDALELRAYEMASEGKAAPTWFVTRDSDFPEGVHSAHLARELGWLEA